ncbi:unnamed protein product [Effrenium voratum]|nr:unnamed protein product [Effrenium voratum]
MGRTKMLDPKACSIYHDWKQSMHPDTLAQCIGFHRLRLQPCPIWICKRTWPGIGWKAARILRMTKLRSKSRALGFVIALVLWYGLDWIFMAKSGGMNAFVLPPQKLAQSLLFQEADDAAPAAATAASTANLAKNIVGAGVLSLPAGAAKVVDAAEGEFGHESCILALVVMYIFFGALNAYGFYLIGEVCELTGARTYQEAWTKTLGKRLAWLPSAASLICSFTGMVACASVVGDTAFQLATSMSADFIPKEMLLNGIATCVFLPLCLLPSLSPLAFASVLGLVGVCILAFVMTTRCFDGSYALGGAFYSDARAAVSGLSHVQAAVQDPSVGLFQQIFIFAAMLSNAFSAHFNAPTIFQELQPQADSRGRSSRLPEFATVTAVAFVLSGIVFGVITVTGLETFGSSGSPSILQSYSPADPLVWLARIGLGLCVLFEFPLLERCFRQTAVELFGLPKWLETNALTVMASIASSVALACMPGFGLDKASAFGGALGASLLIYVAPALMSLQLRQDRETKQTVSETRWDMVLRGVAGLGSALGGLGVAESMQA